jgi:LPS O-antigen subunit length determinant protein (WzzB/FepE family)
MADVDLSLLGRHIERLLDGQRAIEERLARIEQTMATREQLTRVWTALDDRISRVKDTAIEGSLSAAREELEVRLASYETRLRALEER